MSSVHVCPVCKGRGTVPAGFYKPGVPTKIDAERVTCRGCGGTGVITTPDRSIYPPCKPDRPWYYTYPVPWWYNPTRDCPWAVCAY